MMHAQADNPTRSQQLLAAIDAKRVDRMFKNLPLGVTYRLLGNEAAAAERERADALRTITDKLAAENQELYAAAGRAAIKRGGGHKKKGKRSKAEANDTDLLIIAKITEHHKYQDGGCLNFTPITYTELAEKTGLSGGRLTIFFDKHFADGGKGGNKRYKRSCHDGTIRESLRLLNREYAPSILHNNTGDFDFDSLADRRLH